MIRNLNFPVSLCKGSVVKDHLHCGRLIFQTTLYLGKMLCLVITKIREGKHRKTFAPSIKNGFCVLSEKRPTVHTLGKSLYFSTFFCRNLKKSVKLHNIHIIKFTLGFFPSISSFRRDEIFGEEIIVGYEIAFKN